MNRATLRRVERWLTAGGYDDHERSMFALDVRALLALAKQAVELRSRMASIRYIIKRASHDPDTMAIVRDLLDLRKPLPKGRGR